MKTPPRLGLVALGLVLVIGRSALAQDFWQPLNGLSGVTATSAAASGANVFVGTRDGLFCSTDGGTTWTFATGLTNRQVNALAADRDAVFAGTFELGVFRSTDQCRTWVPLNNGLADDASRHVQSLAVDGARLLMGTNNAGAFVSSDRGASWRRASTGLANMSVWRVAIAGSRLLAGTSRGLFASDDDGANWSAVPAGTGVVDGIAVSGNDVFAVSTSLMRSADRGTTWSPVGNLGRPTALAMNGSVLFAGTTRGGLRSPDEGATWSGNDLPDGDVSMLAAGGDSVFAVLTGIGVFRTSDDGRMWSAVGRLPAYVAALASSGNRLLAGTDGGVFYSSDGGTTWAAATGIVAHQRIDALVVNGSTVYAAGRQVFQSTDGGTTWRATPDTGGPASDVSHLAVSGTSLFAATLNSGVLRLDDGASKWLSVNNGLPPRYVVSGLATVGGAIFATSQSQVFRSTDNGATWTPTGHAGTVLASSGSDLFVAGASGGWRAADNGETWVQQLAGAPEFQVLGVSGANLILGAWRKGPIVSSDRGDTWRPAVGGLLTNDVRAALVDDAGYGFVGTPIGLFRSREVLRAAADRDARAKEAAASSLAAMQDAASRGEPAAETALGSAYLQGTGVAKNEQQALTWFQKAADQGYGQAEDRLGLMYVGGVGVTRDYARGVSWLRKAADQGNVEAQFNLGLAAANGFGIPRDGVEAHKWLNLAAFWSSQSQVMRDAVAKTLSPADLSTSRARAAEWLTAFEKDKRPQPPKGYSWERAVLPHTFFLRPDGWHFRREDDGGEFSYFVTKQPIPENATSGDDQFDTGFTINVVRRAGATGGGRATEYAANGVEQLKKNAAMQVVSITPVDGVSGSLMDVLATTPKQQRVHMRCVFFGDDATDTLISVTFEAPVDRWTAEWSVAEPAFAEMVNWVKSWKSAAALPPQ